MEEEEEEELHNGNPDEPNFEQDEVDPDDVSGATFDGQEDHIDEANPMALLLAALVQRLQMELKTSGPATHNWLLAHLKCNDFWLLTSHLQEVLRRHFAPTPHPCMSCALTPPR